jgi:hypothetical protein
MCLSKEPCGLLREISGRGWAVAKFGSEEVVQGGTTRQGGESNKHPIDIESKNRHPTNSIEEVFIALFTLNIAYKEADTAAHAQRGEFFKPARA